MNTWPISFPKNASPLIAGPLIDLTEGEVTDWMYIWEHDFRHPPRTGLRIRAEKSLSSRLSQVQSQSGMSAYGIHTNSVFTLSFEQIIELTRLLVSQVKTLIPNAAYPRHNQIPLRRTSLPVAAPASPRCSTRKWSRRAHQLRGVRPGNRDGRAFAGIVHARSVSDQLHAG